MKREACARHDLAVHEAGHLVAIAITPGLSPGALIWQRLPRCELAHVEVTRSRGFDWDQSRDRNALIARHAAVALAGGAAELVLGAGVPRRLDLRAILDRVGRTDFELAHEWLLLQRYDPDQDTLERELQRMFHHVVRVLDAPPARAAIAAVHQRLLAHLRSADRAGLATLRLRANDLLAGLRLEPCVDFTLQATLLER